MKFTKENVEQNKDLDIMNQASCSQKMFESEQCSKINYLTLRIEWSFVFISPG